MSVSARDCYDLGHENCATDSRCVLEYTIENENPTCVPRRDQRQLTDHEVRVLERILEQILVQFSSPNTIGGNALDQSIQRLVHELRPMVDWKIRSLTSEGSISSWTNGIANVSRNIIGIINLPGQDIQGDRQQRDLQAAIRRVLDENERWADMRRDQRYQRRQQARQRPLRQRDLHYQRDPFTLRDVADISTCVVIIVVIVALVYDMDVVDLMRSYL